jgi:cytochrome c553
MMGARLNFGARARCAPVLLAGLLGLAGVAGAQEPGQAKAPVKTALCVTCHGPLGMGLTPDTPHIAAQPQIYLVAQLKAFRSGARKHEVMNVIARPLTDAEITELAEWYSSVRIEVRAP